MSLNQEEQAPMAFPARLAGVFASPSRVFQELVRRPTWLAALLAVTLATAALNTLVLWSDTGEKAVRQQFQEEMEKRGQTVPPEALDRQITLYRYAGPISVLIALPVVTLLLAGLVFLIFSMGMGGEATYKQTFSAYAHANLIGIVGGVVATAMIFIKGNMKSSTALTAFLPFLEETSFAYKFCQGLDLFIIWQLAVVAIGIGILNKMTTRKAATVLFSTYLALWLVITVVRQALS